MLKESLASFGLLIAKHKKREEEGIVAQEEVELEGFDFFFPQLSYIAKIKNFALIRA